MRKARKNVSFTQNERNVKTFVQDETDRKRHLQNIVSELQKTGKRSHVDLYCIQNLGTWMSMHQIFDFEDLELKKDSLNDIEYKVMRVCLNAKLNPKSVSQDDFKFVQDFANKLIIERKQRRKERTLLANMELQKDLEELDALIAQREQKKKQEDDEIQREQIIRKKRQEEDEIQRQQFNRTTYLGLEPMDTSDDMIDFTNLQYEDEDEEEDEEGNNDIGVTQKK